MSQFILPSRPDIAPKILESYAAYEAARNAYRAEMTAYVQKHLELGGTVVEHLNPDMDIYPRWSMVEQSAVQRTFRAEFHTPEYIAEHLMNRCMGFGWKLELL